MNKSKILSLSCALAASAMLVACGDKATQINANDYLNVTIEGSQNFGVAGYKVDVEKMVQDNYEAFGLKENHSNEEYSIVLNNIMRLGAVGSLDKDSELSNGDTVTWTWNAAWLSAMEAAYNVEFNSPEPVSQEATSLVEAQEFNPFDYVSITYEKVPDDDPSSKASSFLYGKDLKISIEESDLSPVDGLLLSISSSYVDYGESWRMVYTAPGAISPETYCLEQGYIITETEKEFTAPTSLES